MELNLGNYLAVNKYIQFNFISNGLYLPFTVAVVLEKIKKKNWTSCILAHQWSVIMNSRLLCKKIRLLFSYIEYGLGGRMHEGRKMGMSEIFVTRILGCYAPLILSHAGSLGRPSHLLASLTCSGVTSVQTDQRTKPLNSLGLILELVGVNELTNELTY